ncbi:hypothetical membrane protein [Pseudomonas knackmussii B13]|uniref:Hypothetical membrane protein n=1 Tax=Pseudomonas knackmussii (strain DSM 6978 / CCUG 54928 / LMG 23759 / B13) TaxID=1301098 RepID=A0A024HDG8_PSEKB|nr:hypothetical protein [Pseudomonas knackmussii]CDF82619.1 hypothetical membrane protein [Pseudomonas knackmussii B13]
MRNALLYAGSAIALVFAVIGFCIIVPVIPAFMYWEWGCHL